MNPRLPHATKPATNGRNPSLVFIMARREFHFIDGTSNKFWTIELTAERFTVHYGRIGTTGQAQEKSFASAELAKREHDKLVQEKTKKGYVETAGAGPAITVPAPITKQAVKKAKVEPAANEASPPVSASEPIAMPVFSGTLESSLKLPPRYRHLVTWETHEPLPKSASPEFQRDVMLEKLKSVQTNYGYYQWNKIEIPEFPSQAEARFWLRVAKACQVDKKEETTVVERLTASPDDLVLTFQDILDAFSDRWGTQRNLIACVAALLPLDQLVKFLVESAPQQQKQFPVAELFARVLPYLSAGERGFVRQSLSGSLKPTVPATYYHGWPPHYYFAAMVGLPQEIAPVASAIPDQHYGTDTRDFRHDYYSSPHWLIFGLPDRATVIAEARRIGIKLRDADHGFAWLALTGHEALDLIAISTCEAGNKEEAAAIACVLSAVVSPEAAFTALQITVNSKASQYGVEWLKKNPLHAVVGLVPVAAGTGKLAQAAREHLHKMRRGSELAVLEAAKVHLSPEGIDWLQREVIDSEEAQLSDATLAELPEDLRSAFEATAKTKLPPWVEPASFPPVKVGEKKLATAEVAMLLGVLKSLPLGSGSPLFEALNKHADRTSLDAFVWKLYDTWLIMGAPSKDKWAMGALGQLGGDSVVLRLTPLVRQWPGESQHQRAVFGLECLRVVGSDTALMALNGIAQKLKFKALKEKAQAMMQGIAESRGMSREELADRIVPDCGLDARGRRTFDFGPRQFEFVLGPEMKPLIKDAAGKLRPDLPSPNQSDDSVNAAAEVAEWKLLKKTLKEVLKIQAERLEEAMITGRRWSPEEFDALLIKHPLMTHLVRQLVFAAYGDGGIVQTFRVTEDQTIADENDDEFPLPPTGRIGVVHPAHLSDSAKSAWGQVMSDYEIIPPFQQLGRAICHPEPEDLALEELTRFRGPKMPGITVYGILERNHWLRDVPADGGGFAQHLKHFPSADITAFITYSGMSIGYYDEEQEIESVYFVPGHVKPEMWGQHVVRVKIGDVDRVVLSEVLRLVHAILSKAG